MRWFKRFIFIVLVLAGILGILLILATVNEFRPRPVEQADLRGNTHGIRNTDSIFSILTWNIGYFGLGKDCDFFYDGGRMTRPSKSEYFDYSGNALNYLGRMTGSDFYFFQEVDVRARRSYYDDQVIRFRKLFPEMESSFAYNYRVGFVPTPLRNPMGKVESGILTFSLFHTIENTRYAFPGGYGWPVRLFMLKRCFLLSRIPMPGGKELVLINTHNEAFDNGDQRRQQLAVLKDLMLKEFGKGNYVIAGGDWNQNPVGYNIKLFSNYDAGRRIEPEIEPDFFPAGWKWAYDPEFPSNRDVKKAYKKGDTQTTIIDFFVVSPNVSVVKVSTDDLGFAWSDHQPVRMEFKLK